MLFMPKGHNVFKNAFDTGLYIYINCITDCKSLLFKATYNKYIRQKKMKHQYFAVGTVRMFTETS